MTLNDHGKVIHGDAYEALKALPDNSIDALVTDPPSGIAFMGKEWDKNKGGGESWISWLTGIMREVYRILKPGAYGVVWALPRTSHWTAQALERSGFEIRDKIYHHFGEGFPKSLDVGKVVPEYDGYGTGLKPSTEEWILIRKPLSEAGVAKNVLRWGTGAINIDGCRIPATDGYGPVKTRGATKLMEPRPWNARERQEYVSGSLKGRWPSHLLLSHSYDCTQDTCDDDCPIPILDAESYVSRYFQTFYYASKASRKEREAGCETIVPQQGFDKNTSKTIAHINYQTGETTYNEYIPSIRHNGHPTIKPLKLVSYLVRLVTPPHGVVLDPFAGSGTTGIACVCEKKYYVLIEQEEQYIDIIYARLSYAEKGGYND